MKQIELTQGQVAAVDDEDFDRVNQFKWYAMRHGRTFYAVRDVKINGMRTAQLLHRVILNLPPGRVPEADHRDGNGLNNCRSNLRTATHQQNNCNRRKRRYHLGKSTSSEWKGVSWHKQTGKWRAQIGGNGNTHHLGLFDSEEAAVQLHGEFARVV